MKLLDNTPLSDGFYMPAEFAEHEGTIMIWPQRPGSWPYGAKEAKKAFIRIAEAVIKSERVFVLCEKEHINEARALLPAGTELFETPSDDAWARDTAPTFVVNKNGLVRGVKWSFNAWGGDFDGLYKSWDKDDALALSFCEKTGFDCYDARPFVLEGGSVHSDGEGTLLVTESCLLSPGRNPSLTKSEIEEKLKSYLGAKKIIWLPDGIYNDETNGHVDNICAFIKPAEVVLAWTDNKNDPQYALSSACLRVLEKERDAKGRPFKVNKLPIPDYPVLITKKDLDGLVFEEGEDRREEGERLAASYVNFYFTNNALLLPCFGGENEESDRRAQHLMKELCPGREIICINAGALIVGGGNIHCLTQQIPKGAQD